MTNLEKYQHTISVLVKAFLNDTLEKGNCSACAVGNLVADALGYKYKKDIYNNLDWENVENKYDGWVQVICSTSKDTDYQQPFFNENELFCQLVNPEEYKGEPKRQIDAVGYSIDELAGIEWAFETASIDKGVEGQYDGLMAVVDVLATIHGINQEVAESSKLLFVK